MSGSSHPVPNEPSDHLKLCPGCRKVRIYKEVDVCAACSNKGRKGEPSDVPSNLVMETKGSSTVSAIGDELDRQLVIAIYGEPSNDSIWKYGNKANYYQERAKWPQVVNVKRVLEEQTKLARIDELYNVIKMEYQTNYDYIVQLSDVENRIADLEASIKERSEDE